LWRWQLRIRPLSDKIRQDLGLDGLARGIGERLAHQFHGPLGDPARRIGIADDLPQREGGNHRDGVGLEVVAQLAPREDHRVQQLLDLRVAHLGVRQDLADVIDRLLDRQGVPFLRALHYDHSADNLGGRGHVELQGLAVLRRCEDRGVRQGRLQLVERLLGLGGPGEALVLLEEAIEGQALLTEPRDEAAQGGKAPQHLLHPLRSRIRPIRSRAVIFSGLASIPRWETMYPRSMPRGTPKTHF
jgi:hypothetical protein